jgi:signal transduction histidine kinase
MSRKFVVRRLPAWKLPIASDWERVAALIVIKIQWFGLAMGYLLANLPGRGQDSSHLLNVLLAVGLTYACIDAYCFLRGKVFILSRYPLVVSFLETIFITLLCRYDTGLDSPYRYYYLLSLLVSAIRYPVLIPYLSCMVHCVSFTLLYLVMPEGRQDLATLILNIVVMAWVTWAASTLARFLHQASAGLKELNQRLQEEQAYLEVRIQERTKELQEAQAHLVQQEKMAAFGLLAAGIAHEVGNPLTSISSLVQLAQRRAQEPYVQEKLTLVGGQLDRISGTLRELVTFSRPTSDEKVWTDLAGVAREALSIAKYYKSIRGKSVTLDFPEELPHLHVSRDQLTQAVLNLVLNAIDATATGGQVMVRGRRTDEAIVVEVQDDGCGIAAADVAKLFQPYYTTKPHGTGLGLFMTRRLVEQQGGNVAFDSAPGRGTTFRLHFPLTPGHHVDTTPDRQPAESAAAPAAGR